MIEKLKISFVCADDIDSIGDDQFETVDTHNKFSVSDTPIEQTYIDSMITHESNEEQEMLKEIDYSSLIEEITRQSQIINT